MLATLERPTREVDPMSADDLPVMVSRPLTVVLDELRLDMKDGFGRIQQGVDSANSALALKADKTDVEELRERVEGVESGLVALKAWRAGFLVALGLSGGLLSGLVLNASGVV